MKLAVASPLASAYSETFIHMQMERLPCALRVYGTPVSTETVPGGPISPLRSMRGMFETAYYFGIQGTRWEGPQSAELSRRLKNGRITVLLANYGPSGVALAPVCRRLDIPLVVHFHGYDAHRRETVDEMRGSYRALAEQVSAVIAVSDLMVRTLESLGFPRRKIRLHRCGVDQHRFAAERSALKRPTFFGVGRFVDKKAPYLTVAAFKMVYDRYPDARLILAGDGALLEVTRNVATTLGVGDAVEFPGVLPPQKVAEHMRMCTAYVQHSITPVAAPSTGDSEGTPVAILEAMMSAAPVVSTRHSGIGEVIEDGVTGYLVEERDVNGMAKAMRRVIEFPHEATGIGQAARAYALEHFTADQYIESLRNLLASVA